MGSTEQGSDTMNTDTTIAKNIRVADEKASYDAACKRLLSEKIILAWIMIYPIEETGLNGVSSMVFP